MERRDNSKEFITEVIRKNNRLEMYGVYLRYAQQQQYKVCTMKDFYSEISVKEGKTLALRHDVDYKQISTRKMFEREVEVGVKSTYYFRWNTIDLDLINDMLKEKFEVGLHFETLSDYAERAKKKQIDKQDIEVARQQLKNEIKCFNEMIGAEIVSIASHGSPVNKTIGMSNNVLLEGEKYDEYGICFEAYDEKMYQYVDEHIMDCNVRHNYGFAYKSNPIDAINQNKKKIVFLSHPNHWYNVPMRKGIDIIQFMRGECTYSTEREFKRIMEK